MALSAVAIGSAGLVTSVGLSAAATCAAIRGAISNHVETHFVNVEGDPILGAQVVLEEPWEGRSKLVQMVSLALEECLAPVAAIRAGSLPLLLCVAETSRPGRVEGLDSDLFWEIQATLETEFHPAHSGILPLGRVAVVQAIARARQLLSDSTVPAVVVAATDSLLVADTLSGFDEQGRLLSELNSNGFVPGEAAGALLVTRDGLGTPHLLCDGLGVAVEAATIDSEQPLRGDGLVAAIRNALADAGVSMGDLDYRITDNSGEQYYFKEAALALGRVLRPPKDQFDIWHPAECIGETGAAIGVVGLAVALRACVKDYSLGPRILFHAGNDHGQRVAAVLRYAGA